MELEMKLQNNGAVVVKYHGHHQLVVIPDAYKGVPVTEIGIGAFEGSAVVGVVIPLTLRVIGENAFSGCSQLRYIGSDLDDPPAPEEQENYDFDEILPNLSILPPDLQIIESGAFKGTDLRRVDSLATTIMLGDSAFERCRNLKSAAFFECTDLTFGTRVFMDSTISQFMAPKARIEELPAYCFANCHKLERMVTCIMGVGDRSFYECHHLRKLYAPKQLRHVGNEAFTGCHQLQKFIEPVEKSDVPDTNVPLDHLAEPVKPACVPPDTGEFAGQTPLFRMIVDHPYGSALPLAAQLKGIFKKDGQQFRFHSMYALAFSDATLITVPGKDVCDFAPTLNLVTEKHLVVTLRGVQKETTYWVYEVLPVLAENEGSNISPELFREMSRFLNAVPTVDAEADTAEPPFYMHTEEEFDAFLNICGSRVPGWVRRAYQKNKQTIAHNRRNSSEAQHAQLTQEILMNIDWHAHTMDIPDAKQVRKLLDESFFGLEEVKTRIMEIVAQIRRSGKLPKWGILLNGPAGTGKTTIAKTIARVLSMALIQMDMSTVGEDTNEICGASRIYANARPGMIVENMFRNRSSTALLLVNEIEKAGNGKNGRSPANVLLSILDKTGYYENFLEEVIPTDNLFCIATCNELDKISKPLRDRFLLINIPAYTPAEKKVIFRDHIFPSILENSRLAPGQISLDEEAHELLISEYAIDPGARDLEQYTERLVGDYCLHTDLEDDVFAVNRVYRADDLRYLFGPGRTVKRHFAADPGEVNGAFYYNGQAHFFLMEAAITPGTGKFEVLGPMDDLQKMYCKAAYLCVRNTVNASSCELSFQDVTVFVSQPIPGGMENHVGFACYAAICSKLLNRNLANNHTCFIGGCDLNGSLYFDEPDLSPLLRAMQARGVSTVYAPVGANRLATPGANPDCSVTIIEAPDAPTLFTLAAAQIGRKAS